METKTNILMLILLTGFIFIPSRTFSGTPVFRIDMDAYTPGYQNEIWVLPGERFTTNVEVFLDTGNDTISSFGYSLWWDASELKTPTDTDITAYSMGDGWEYMNPEHPYHMIVSDYIYNFAQFTFGYSEGSLARVIASINWTASHPKADGFFDIVPGFVYYPHSLDGAWDKDGNELTSSFEGGTVNILPEPLSAILFLTGGLILVIGRLFCWTQ